MSYWSLTYTLTHVPNYLFHISQLLSVLFSPDHRTDPPAPPSTALAPGLCGTPGCLWGQLEPWGPVGRGSSWKQQVWVLGGGRAAAWRLQVRSNDILTY